VTVSRQAQATNVREILVIGNSSMLADHILLSTSSQ
jgi:hypothetical protein